MQPIILTALGVGGATVIGALLGFIFKKPSHKMNDIILSFAAGIMLCAAVVGLILPSFETNNALSVFLSTAGVFCGAMCIELIDKLVPHIHKITGQEEKSIDPTEKNQINKVLLFVIAIAIHNLPEGIAAGVSFGTDNTSHAITVSIGIALQNIPEGMVIIAPMIAGGISHKKTFIIASLTGLVEVVGTFLGYFAVNVSEAILPFALAIAGGTMLYIISNEMIPETHSHGYERQSTYSLITGFMIMMLFDHFLG